MSKLISIHKNDNVAIVRKKLKPGDVEILDGRGIVFTSEIKFGHKIACRAIRKGEKINKNNTPIGSATEDIAIGDHVHLHNMKSDYIETYKIDHEPGYDKH